MPWSPYDPSFGGFWEGGKHWSEVVADDALDYLKDAAAREEPFFMYLAFNAAHDPRQSPKEYVEKYPLEKVSLPEPFYAEYPYDIGSNKIRDEQLAPFPRTEYAVKVNRGEYYAIITHMDAQIGRILEGLEKSGKGQNTYIVFTADHGLACGHHGLMGKQNMHDHSVRVPFLVVGPDVPQDRRLNSPIYLQDVVPTTLEWAGVPKPEHVEFQSLAPLLAGDRDQLLRRHLRSLHPNAANVRPWAGINSSSIRKSGKVMLFDLKTDPLETNDLADNPESRPKIQKLLAKFKSLQKTTGDTLDLDKAFAKARK